MIETRRAWLLIHAFGSRSLYLSRDTSMRVGRSIMQTQRTVDGAPTPPSPELTLVTAPVVPQRSVRRATARRASNRRATARRRKDDVEGRIVEYLKDHPRSTTGDIAKGLNANRGTVAAGLSHLVRAGEITKDYAVE
jgi:hypothetical protein